MVLLVAGEAKNREDGGRVDCFVERGWWEGETGGWELIFDLFVGMDVRYVLSM